MKTTLAFTSKFPKKEICRTPIGRASLGLYYCIQGCSFSGLFFMLKNSVGSVALEKYGVYPYIWQLFFIGFWCYKFDFHLL